MSLDVDTAERLGSSWQLALRAQRKSPQTLKAYGDGLRLYLAWCAESDAEPLRRSSLNLFTAHLLDNGAAASTARSRQLAVRRFAAWLAEEEEIPADPFLGIKSPKLDERVVEPLSDDDLRAILKTCQVAKGTEPSVAMRHRRDEAIIRLMFETGARAGEVVAIEMPDLNLGEGAVIIRRGKGGKGRVVPFGPEVALSLDRYLRLRSGHRLAATDALWLGDRGKRFSYDALHKTLGERAKAAGIEGFHPHRLRHTAAHRWLAAGGSESGLMAVAGWARPDMLMRYTKGPGIRPRGRGSPQAEPGGVVSLKVPPDLFDPDAGDILAVVVCDSCGNKVVGVVQERWTEPTPRGEEVEALQFRGYLGKVRRPSDGARGTAVTSSPVTPGRLEKRTYCPRHGEQSVRVSVERDSRNVVLRSIAQRTIE
ncbi:MAG TPA: tyrosine-type recombinase/integrase [Nocardioides sp.]|nr:tyrosine-type recombinase/integrase [Nocardioides sp.]